MVSIKAMPSKMPPPNARSLCQVSISLAAQKKKQNSYTFSLSTSRLTKYSKYEVMSNSELILYTCLNILKLF